MSPPTPLLRAWTRGAASCHLCPEGRSRLQGPGPRSEGTDALSGPEQNWELPAGLLGTGARARPTALQPRPPGRSGCCPWRGQSVPSSLMLFYKGLKNPSIG